MSRRSPAFDVSGVVWEWLHRRGVSDKERMTLMAEVRTDLFQSGAAKILLGTIGAEAVAQKLNPVSVTALGLTYGAAIGTLMEQRTHRAGDGRLEVEESVCAWITSTGISHADRRDLLLTLQTEFRNSENAKRLIREITEEAMAAQFGAVDLMLLSLNYGLTLGVLLERERFERYLRKVV